VKLVRKCPEVFITNSAVAGQFSLNDPTGSMLQLTSPGTATGFLNTYDIPFAMKFNLRQIINSSELTTLCDKYMIKKTVIKIYFNSNQSSVASTTSLPQLTYSVDYDDAVIPTTSTLRERMDAKIKYFTNRNMVQITLYPRPTAQIFNTGVLVPTAYSPGKQMWVDSIYNEAEHYGLKGVFQNVNLNAVANQIGFKWDVTHTVYGKDIL